MNEEKRQTRLLPFRLRRAGAMRRFGGETGEDAGADSELTALLRTWDAPLPSDDARARLLADFRMNVARPSLWRRAITSSVRVPLPLAACALVALIASLAGLAALARPRPANVETQVSSVAPVVKVVEVPVVQERVVTRVVYVEKDGRDERLGMSSKTLPRAITPTRGLTAMNARGSKPVAGSLDAGEPASFVTRVDMDDFRPADEMKIRVIKKGRSDEK